MITGSSREPIRRRLLAVAAAGMLLTAACGNDDDGDDGDAAAGGDTAAYCDVARAIAEADAAPSQEQMEAARDLAPDEIADDVAFVVGELLERGPAAFGDSDVQERFGAIDEFEERECGIEARDFSLPDGVTTEPDPDAQQVAVSATEYEFSFDAPTAGAASFSMSNDGDEPHHMIIVKLVDGLLAEKTLDEILEEDDDAFFELEAASDVAPPGDQAVLSFEALEAGDYVIACFIPDPDGTPHAFLGMIDSFNVAEAG